MKRVSRIGVLPSVLIAAPPPALAGWAPRSLSLGRNLGSGPALQVLDQVLEEFRPALA